MPPPPAYQQQYMPYYRPTGPGAGSADSGVASQQLSITHQGSGSHTGGN